MIDRLNIDRFPRLETKLLKEKGYNLKDMEIIEEFEKKVAHLAGSKYGIAVSSCTNGIFLSLLYLKSINELKDGDRILMPNRSYMSVCMSILNAGLKINFEDIPWTGDYQLKPTCIYDAATRFTEEMYIKDSLYVVSFQYHKILPIGRGGMILTDDIKVRDWLRIVRFNGRHIGIPQKDDVYDIQGWNMYITPDDAARGILIFDELPRINQDCGCSDNYPDLSKQELFQ